MGRKVVVAIALACAVAFGLMSMSVAHASPAAADAGSAGCGTASPVRPGRSVDLSLNVGNIERSYLLHVPSTYRTHVAMPLVLAFHGHNNTASELDRETGFSRLSNRDGFIIAYPQGVIGADGQTGWNTGRAGKDPTTSNDLAFVDALVGHLEATMCISTSRIYATGFSNGGGFTAILACERADTFAGVGIVAGDYYPQPEGCHPSRAIQLMEIHGTADEVNPYRGSSLLGYPPVQSWLTDWATRDACTSGPTISMPQRGVMRMEWTGCSRGAVILHYELQGMGHMWPNGNRASDRFNATNVIWSFFARGR